MKTILILLLFPLKIFAQDISGVWTGTLYNDTTQKFVPYEITISEEKGKLSGYSHTTWKPDNVDDIVNIGLKAIKIKRKNNKLYLEDEKWLYNNYAEPPPKGVKQFSLLSIQTGDSGIILSGPFNTNPTKEYAPATGSIRLTRRNDYASTKIIPKLEEMNLVNTLTFLPPKVKEKEVVAIANPPIEKAKLLPTPPKDEEKPVADPDLPKPKPIIEPVITLNKPTVKDVAKNTESKTPEKLQPKPVVIVPPQKVVLKPPVEKPAVVISRPVPKPPVVIPKPKEVVKTMEPETKIPATVIAKPKEIVSLPKNQPLLNITPVPAAELATRKIETIRSVNVKTDSLVLNLYDNGEVDGDTVSVVLNGKTIMSRQGLTANAITKTIYLTPDLGDSIQLIMYAENLGSIPPNTGLLILQDGNERYEIRFAGDLQKNSAIILRRKHN
ncbi:MAG: hypothetical protein ABJA57_02055 [Ginsengibacter sp.]